VHKIKKFAILIVLLDTNLRLMYGENTNKRRYQTKSQEKASKTYWLDRTSGGGLDTLG